MDQQTNAAFAPALLLGHQIFDFLREQIITGQLQEGSRLNELNLQKMFKTSRSPIREAIRRLEVEGLLEVIPRKGAFVRTISVEDLREATEVRACLEAFALRLAGDSLNKETLSELSVILEQMDDKLKGLDIEGYTRLHHAFHRLLVELSGNQMLIRIHAIVTEPFVTNRLTYTYLKRISRFSDIDHHQIYSLLCDGKTGAASRAIEKHVKTLLAAISETREDT